MCYTQRLLTPRNLLHRWPHCSQSTAVHLFWLNQLVISMVISWKQFIKSPATSLSLAGAQQINHHQRGAAASRSSPSLINGRKTVKPLHSSIPSASLLEMHWFPQGWLGLLPVGNAHWLKLSFPQCLACQSHLWSSLIFCIVECWSMKCLYNEICPSV